MTNDPVEEFLVEIEGLVKNRRRYDDWQMDTMELDKVLCHQRTLVPKLLALVRVYRESSEYYRNFRDEMISADDLPSNVGIAYIARAAEEKAKEIVAS